MQVNHGFVWWNWRKFFFFLCRWIKVLEETGYNRTRFHWCNLSSSIEYQWEIVFRNDLQLDGQEPDGWIPDVVSGSYRCGWSRAVDYRIHWSHDSVLRVFRGESDRAMEVGYPAEEEKGGGELRRQRERGERGGSPLPKKNSKNHRSGGENWKTFNQSYLDPHVPLESELLQRHTVLFFLLFLEKYFFRSTMRLYGAEECRPTHARCCDGSFISSAVHTQTALSCSQRISQLHPNQKAQ